MFSIILFQISYITTKQINFMLYPGPITHVTRLPFFTPIGLTNTIPDKLMFYKYAPMQLKIYKGNLASFVISL